MATYTKGELTNRTILSAAEELFYERGYLSSSCTDVAQRAKVNPGLIHYYFKTKKNIALAVYNGFLSQIMERTAEFFPQEDLLVRIAVENRILWKLLECDPAFLRFLSEISTEQIPLDISQSAGEEYLRAINAELTAPVDDKMLRLLCQCSIASESQLILAYAGSACSFTAEALAEMDICILFKLVSMPYQRIQSILNRSRKLMRDLTITADPAFRIAVIRNEKS
ncbi:MAG: TetR/AcrR family transcriptional regulator [Oscillibacter sp.]|nr:TetR/AcrR family transcriptional regulator [Oscillibacter sp.]